MNNNPNMTPGMPNRPQSPGQTAAPVVPPVNTAPNPNPAVASAAPAATPTTPAATPAAPAATPAPAAAPAATPAAPTAPEANNANPPQTPSPSVGGAPTPTRRPTPPKVKKSYNLAVFVGEAFKNLWRDGIMSMASILVLASCLVVLGCFALLVLNINVNMNKLASLNEIVAFTDYEMSEEDALALADEIRKLDNVENVEFISKSQGLEDLKETYPEFSDLFDEFEEDGKDSGETANDASPENTGTTAPTPDDTSKADTAKDTSEAGTTAEPAKDNSENGRAAGTPEGSDAAGSGDGTTAPDGTDTASPPEDTTPADTTAPVETDQKAPAETTPIEPGANRNPLAHCFKIKYADNSKVATLEFNLNEMEGIRKVNNRQDLAMSLENLKNGISMIFIWFLIVLFIVSVFIIINTIKLAVNSHMEEIRVMKYIGASNWFVVLPYIIEGTIIGIFSGAIAFLVEWGIYYKLGSIISTDTPIIELISFDSIRLPVALAFLGIGVLTGVIGSCISLRRNLNA